jgi:hypothetical protein
MMNLKFQTDGALRSEGHRGEHPIPAAALDDRLGSRFRLFVVDNLTPVGLMRSRWG